MGEALQGVMTTYPHPIFTTVLVRSPYALFLLAWMIAQSLRPLAARERLSDPRPKQFILHAAWLSALMLGGQALWYLSLPRTDVAANSAVFNSSTCAVYALSVVFLGEPVRLLKVVALVASIVGVAIICADAEQARRGLRAPLERDAGEPRPCALGYVLAVLSMLVYALYETVYKWILVRAERAVPRTAAMGAGTRRTGPRGAEDGALDRPRALEAAPPGFGTPPAPPTDRFDTPVARDVLDSSLFLGLLGVATALLGLITTPLASATGIEAFALPSPADARLIAVNAALDSLFHFALLLGIALTSPVTMSAGQMLVMPLSAVVDWRWKGVGISARTFCGECLVVAGFFLLHWRAWTGGAAPADHGSDVDTDPGGAGLDPSKTLDGSLQSHGGPRTGCVGGCASDALRVPLVLEAPV